MKMNMNVFNDDNNNSDNDIDNDDIETENESDETTNDDSISDKSSNDGDDKDIEKNTPAKVKRHRGSTYSKPSKNICTLSRCFWASVLVIGCILVLLFATAATGGALMMTSTVEHHHTIKTITNVTQPTDLIPVYTAGFICSKGKVATLLIECAIPDFDDIIIAECPTRRNSGEWLDLKYAFYKFSCANTAYIHTLYDDQGGDETHIADSAWFYVGLAMVCGPVALVLSVVFLVIGSIGLLACVLCILSEIYL